jgi:hypothetical protein
VSVFSWHSFTFMSVAISFLLGGGSAEEGRQKKKIGLYNICMKKRKLPIQNVSIFVHISVIGKKHS